MSSATMTHRRRFGTNPNVNVMFQGIALLECFQNNVRVAAEELSVLILGPFLDLKLFNPPHMDAFFLADTIPRGFSGGRRGFDLVVNVGTDWMEDLLEESDRKNG
jgi:hypothetical protein